MSDERKDTLYGNDFTMDDIIWMGDQPSVKDLAATGGSDASATMGDLGYDLQKAIQSGRKIHMLPTYRGDHVIKLAELLGVSCEEVKSLCFRGAYRSSGETSVCKGSLRDSRN